MQARAAAGRAGWGKDGGHGRKNSRAQPDEVRKIGGRELECSGSLLRLSPKYLDDKKSGQLALSLQSTDMRPAKTWSCFFT